MITEEYYVVEATCIDGSHRKSTHATEDEGRIQAQCCHEDNAIDVRFYSIYTVKTPLHIW